MIGATATVANAASARLAGKLVTSFGMMTLVTVFPYAARVHADSFPLVCASDLVAQAATPFASDADWPRIFAPQLACRPAAVREGARKDSPALVRYRIHLCRTQAGTDAMSPQQIRAALDEAADEFARGGIVLEEEALVFFTDDDCVVPLGETAWSQATVANTPDGVVPLAFVADISIGSQIGGVAGFCTFFGPSCVLAAASGPLTIHELGHFFGLAHTFECANGIETAATCATSGDFLCDTPPDHGPLGMKAIASCAGGTVLDGSCSGTCGNKTCTDGSKPDGYNWMSYYHCMPGQFSNGQRDFMRCTLDHELAGYNADRRATTTTTLDASACGDVNEDGKLTVTDALAVLRAGVGTFSCPEWLCDYDGSGTISAADALAVLRAAVGRFVPPNCPSA